MVFKFKDALEVRDRILAMDRSLTVKEIQNVLREHTGTMVPHWVRIYMQSMVTSGMLVFQPDGKIKASKSYHTVQ